MRKLGHLGAICLIALAFGSGCGDDGINELPDGPTLEDRDADGVLDSLDNCPDDANTDQVNTDGDADGDACDTDDDNDAIPDGADNCPIVANPDQANSDNDADGDACDGDADGDKVADDADNCPGVANVDQVNTDGDGEGDACDTDDDNDTILDAADNCPLNANEDQLNSDKDSNGNACDDDDDDDTVLDVDDNCPTVPNLDQANGDEDTDGDVCDTDLDNDTVLNDDDNCPLDANELQENLDEDELGDICDNDDDNDGIGDEGDNCPSDANGDQSDIDFDSLGDVCDADDDGDGFDDNVDNCPTASNSDQTDEDGDGAGDSCDPFNDTIAEVVTGQNLVAAGASWSAREDGTVETSSSIVIAGIPANATIRKAFLYWTVIGTEFPTVTFDGTQVTGTEIGQTPDTCWSIGNNIMYRADVTSLVTGNNTFVLTNILSATSPDGQGASLVVTYVDPADTRENFVKVSDGALGFASAGVSSSVTSTINGFTLNAAPDKATVINIVADGQDFPEQLFIQDQEFGAGDPFSGNDGALWDTRQDDITSLLGVGDTAVTTRLVSTSDCLAWSVNAVVIENFVPVATIAAPLPPATSKPKRAPVVTSKTLSVGHRGGMR